jgi:hypothetical protein
MDRPAATNLHEPQATRYTPGRIATLRRNRVSSGQHWGLSSAGRALAWHARGQGFESPRLHTGMPGSDLEVTDRGPAPTSQATQGRPHRIAWLAGSTYEPALSCQDLTPRYLKDCHLIVETPEPNLSRGMRHLNGVYTQAVHRRHLRSGRVLQCRPVICAISRDLDAVRPRDYCVLTSRR